MNLLDKTLFLSVLLITSPMVMAASEKDCLLQGTVQHDERAGEAVTTVKIDSVSKYDEESRCRVNHGKKLEFKLPADPRLQEAPSGSEVKYRYRTDDSGESHTELLSVGA